MSARGRCPNCGRVFARLAQHIRRMHPPAKVHVVIAELEITAGGKRVGFLKEWRGDRVPTLDEILKGGR